MNVRVQSMFGILMGTFAIAACAADTSGTTDDDDDGTEEEVGTSEQSLSSQWSNGFESGNLSGWACSGNCPTVVRSPVASGRYAGHFVLTRDMSTPYRTEVVPTMTSNGGNSFDFGRDYRFTMKYRYEDWAKDKDSEIAPFQIHTRPSTWAGGCTTGSAWSSAPFYMASNSGKAMFNTYGGKVLWSGAVEPHKWLAIDVRFRISTKSDGYVELWKDGVKIGRVNGPNSPVKDSCGGMLRPPYFKMGIYKWNWKDGRPATESKRRQLLIDDVVISPR